MSTHVLYSRPSLMSGVARILDFWGLYDDYSYSDSEGEADALALASDWRAVGEDIALAMSAFSESESRLEESAAVE